MNYTIRYEDWTLEEIVAETMIETDDELVFGDHEYGILKRIRKKDVRFVMRSQMVFFNYQL